MGTRRPSKALRRVLNIKAGEGKIALLLFSYFFLIAAPLAIIKTLRTTDFLVKMGVGALPIAYLLSAIVTGLIVLLHSKIQFRTSLRAVIITSLVFFAVSGLVLQWVLQSDFGRLSTLLPYFYWVWASLLIIVLLTHFWMTANEMLNPREAKRLIGFLSSGGICGGILGGLLVGFLSRTSLTLWLMPLACAMLAGCVLVVRAVFNFQQERPAAAGRAQAGEEVPERQKAGFRDSFNAVRKNKFLAYIAWIVTIGVIVSTCIEFQFLSAASGHFGNRPNALQAFLGFFDPAWTIFALFLNFLVAGYLLKKLGTASALLLTPAVLLAGSLAVLLIPFGLLSGILIRGSDESMAFAVNQSVREILYIPVAAQLRHKAKPFIDMFVSQFAKVGGALILLVFAVLLNKPVEGLTPVFDPKLARELSWVVIALLVPWALFSLRAGKEYLATLRGNIQPLWGRAEKELAGKVDIEHAKLVFDTIDSRNFSSVLYALHLFDLLAQDKLSPDIKKLLSEKSGEVMAAAVTNGFEAEGAAQFPDVLDDLQPEIMLTEIPIIISSEDYQRVMGSYFEKVQWEGRDSEVKKMELAKVIGLMNPDSPLASRLTVLIDDESPRVSCLALKSAARLKNEVDIPAIIRKLRNALTLQDAADALHKYGDRAIGVLEKSLKDRSGETVLRKAVAGVLGRIGTRRAILALVEEFEHGPGDLDEEIIDALDRLRSEQAEIPLSAATIRKKIYSLIREYCQTFIGLERQEADGEKAPLRHRSAGNLQAYLADIFKLLGLSYSQQDIRTAYQNISTGSPHSVAHAVEWLDNTLKKDLKDVVLPLVEDLDTEERVKRFRKILKTLPGL